MPGRPEIERKFIVESLPDDIESLPHAEIEQGYLAVTKEMEVRLRRVGHAHFLTVKRGSGLVRDEAEVPLAVEQFLLLWPFTKGSRLTKTRYYRRLDGMTVEYDVYGGALAGLHIAEVEFSSLDDAASFRGFKGLGRDVTEDKRYANKSLASLGRPSSVD